MYTMSQQVNLLNCYLSIFLVNKDCIAGFLILKVMHKADNVFERTLQIEGEALKKCTTFVNFLGRKADVFATLNCEVYLKYSLLCITPEYRKKGNIY